MRPLLFLLLSMCVETLAISSFRVFEECTTPSGVVGQCRTQPSVGKLQQLDPQGPVQLPIDMRLPCATDSVPCAENVDAVEIPLQPPKGDDIGSCSITLMPWSPFPCNYSDVYQGAPGQTQTDYCYEASTKPSEPGYEHATNLTTNGYVTVFFGALPAGSCGSNEQQGSGGSSESSSEAVGSLTSIAAKSIKEIAAAAAAAAAELSQPGYGRHFAKVLLKLEFRVAAGRQFDRSYTLQIGRAVAAFGTLTEPTRWLGSDKWWAVTVDVTHLQSYFQPGLPTRFNIGNLLSNVYNVPLWAHAKLEYYWKVPPSPSNATAPPSTPTAAAAAEGSTAAVYAADEADSMSFSDISNDGVDVQPEAQIQEATPGDVAAAATAAAAVAAAVDVPDEVIPLYVDDPSYESLVTLSGNGDDRPQQWPRVTFTLPESLSDLGNIYRAQVQVIPKANGCEEFWAMNPSGRGTNSTCQDESTGEPHREVRVYVNGQLAGFYPIYYTMYTGGVDPRMWSAIVASHTYRLPTYTFDLSPWLPQLNSPPESSPASTGMYYSSSSTDAAALLGKEEEEQAESAGDVQLSAAASVHRPPASRRLSQHVMSPDSAQGREASSQQEQQDQQGPAAGQEQQQQPQQQLQAHTITVELAGATGSDWILANTLLLWRATGRRGQPLVVTGQKQPQVVASPDLFEPLESQCTDLGEGNVSIAGECTVALQDRHVFAHASVNFMGFDWLATVKYRTVSYKNVITFNSTASDGGLSWRQETSHEARWSLKEKKRATHLVPESEVTLNPQQDLPGTVEGLPANPSSISSGSGSNQHEAALSWVPAAVIMKQDTGKATLTHQAVRHEWLNAGILAANAPFEYSDNVTLLSPTVFASPSLLLSSKRGKDGTGAAAAGAMVVGIGKQRHYQRAIMLDVYDPAKPTCPVPEHPTHTVALRSTVSWSEPSHSSSSSSSSSRGGPKDTDDRVCVSRWATCGFCAANLTENLVDFRGNVC